MQQTVAYSVAPDSSPVRFLHSLTIPAHTPDVALYGRFVAAVVVLSIVLFGVSSFMNVWWWWMVRGEDEDEEEDDDAYGEHSHVGYYSE